MSNSIDPQFNRNLLFLDHYEKQKSLYLVDFKEGEVQEKTGIGWLIAQAANFFRRVSDFTFGTSFIDEKEREKFQEIFTQNADYLRDATTQANEAVRAMYGTLTPGQKETVQKVKLKGQDILFQRLGLPPSFRDLQTKLNNLGVLSKDLKGLAEEVKRHPDKLRAPENLLMFHQCLEASALIKAYFKEVYFPEYKEILSVPDWNDPNLSPDLKKKKQELLQVMKIMDDEQFAAIHKIAKVSREIQAIKSSYPEVCQNFLKILEDSGLMNADLSAIAAPTGSHATNLPALKAEFKMILKCLEMDQHVQWLRDALREGGRPAEQMGSLQFMINMLEQDPRIQQIHAIAEDYKHPDAFITHFGALHREFGTTVAIDPDTANPMPSQAQLERAFAIVLGHLNIPPPDSAAGGAFLARLVQYVMVGKRLDEVQMPTDDLCFTCRELYPFREDIDLTTHTSALEWHVKESSGSFENGSYKDDVFIKKVPEEQASRNQVINYVNQHFKDAHRSQPIVVGGRPPLNPQIPAEYDQAVGYIHDDYLQYLLDPSIDLAPLQVFNASFCRSLGLPEDFTADSLNEMLVSANKGISKEGERRQGIVRGQSVWKAEELEALKAKYRTKIRDEKTDVQIEEELNKLLRLHLLRGMMLWNQSLFGITPMYVNVEEMDKFDPQTKMHFKMKVSPVSGQLTADRIFALQPDRFATIQEVPISIPSQDANTLGIPTASDQETIHLLKYSTHFVIHSMTEMQEKDEPAATLVNYADVRVRPHALPALGKIIETFRPTPLAQPHHPIPPGGVGPPPNAGAPPPPAGQSS